jgi:bacterioferritin-associated ferredoxin
VVLCVCRAVSTQKVDAAIERGARSLEAVGRTTGAGTDCGACTCDIEARIECAVRKADAERSRSLFPLALAQGAI